MNPSTPKTELQSSNPTPKSSFRRFPNLYYIAPPALGQPQKDPTHTANFGVKLQEKCQSVHVPCELVYPGAPDVKHSTPQAFLISNLKSPNTP